MIPVTKHSCNKIREEGEQRSGRQGSRETQGSGAAVKGMAGLHLGQMGVDTGLCRCDMVLQDISTRGRDEDNVGALHNFLHLLVN